MSNIYYCISTIQNEYTFLQTLELWKHLNDEESELDYNKLKMIETMKPLVNTMFIF